MCLIVEEVEAKVNTIVVQMNFMFENYILKMLLLKIRIMLILLKILIIKLKYTSHIIFEEKHGFFAFSMHEV